MDRPSVIKENPHFIRQITATPKVSAYFEHESSIINYLGNFFLEHPTSFVAVILERNKIFANGLQNRTSNKKL
jgi:hypothetical protein